MKTLAGYVSVLVCGSVLVGGAYGQDAGSTNSGQSPAICDNPPCATVSCGGQPCPEGGPATRLTGRTPHVIPPMTPERRERIDQEKRYSMLFGDLEADEQEARSSEAAGDAANAAFWRARLARKSGLTPEEADAVKKIAAQYRKDFVTLNAQCRADLVAMKPTFAAEHAAGQPYSPVPSCDELRALFPKVMADLLTTLGSRSFSRLDGYARHRLDNAMRSSPLTPPPTTQSEPSTEAGPAGGSR